MYCQITLSEEQLHKAVEKAKSEIIQVFPSVQPERWIPCSERLPEDGENVFVYMFGDSPYIAWINDGLWETDDFACEKEENPVAWMPLPEPYREGEQDENR